MGINGVVAHHNHPVLAGRFECVVQPVELGLHVLLVGVGVGDAVGAVAVDEGCGVNEHHTHACAFACDYLGVVARGHHPTAAHCAIVEHGLCVAAVLVVAQHGKPVEHEFGVGVHLLVVGCPQGVVYRGHTIKVVYVAHGQHAFGAECFAHVPHEFGYGLLVVIAVAPHVVGHVHGYIALHGFPFGRCLGLHFQCGSQQHGHGAQHGQCGTEQVLFH